MKLNSKFKTESFTFAISFVVTLLFIILAFGLLKLCILVPPEDDLEAADTKSEYIVSIFYFIKFQPERVSSNQ